MVTEGNPIFENGVQTGTTAHWEWNGDMEKPVVTPSLDTDSVKRILEPNGRWRGEWELDGNGKPIPVKCHCFIGSNGAPPGFIIFLGDSSHHLAGKTVPLPELPEYLRTHEA